MMRGFALLAVAALAACSPASEPAAETPEAKNGGGTLREVLAADIRADDRARDQFRHPAETLEFLRVEPGMTVIEYIPGGGWYTRILAPYLAESGQYVGVSFPPETFASRGEDAVERLRQSGPGFSAKQAKALGLSPDKVPFYFSDAIPAAIKGKVDHALIIREMHNLKRWGISARELGALREALKPGGYLGVVQHRAKPDAPAAYADGSKGYLKQAEVIALIEAQGFELVEASEINANPKDSADYPGGVWTLPPSFSLGAKDRDKYAAIGESDRMTLLFRKPE
jgi:predicted methyltransferase